MPPGAVVSADPAPGTEVAIETAVDLVVSGGPTPVPVPDVVNDTEQAARTPLEQAGFVVALAAQLVADGGDGVGRRRRPVPGSRAPTTAPDRP